MKKRDLTFDAGREIFSLVVRAIIISDNKLLAVKNTAAGYYYTIGGCIHANESSDEAIMREIIEETGIDMEIDRFGFLHENFYDRDGILYHEIGLYYYIQPIPGLSGREIKSSKGDVLEWLPLDALHEMEFYPTFFKTRLLHPKTEIEHVFTWENIGRSFGEE